MIKILAIGNSFSQDATAYLYNIAACDNLKLKVVNLYIGGCSLESHWNNARNDEVSYQYELNGKSTDRYISIKEALQEDDWDFVTMQQVSNDSGIIDSYYPYINYLSDYIKKYAPKAKQLIHQTWAYEIDSDHEAFVKYDNNQRKMYKALLKAYNQVAKEMSLNIIPCGEVIQRLRVTVLFNYEKGGFSLCRDGFHLSFDYGRYAAAATWYQTLTGNSIMPNTFVPPSENEDNDKYIKLIKEVVNIVCSNLPNTK